MKRDLGMSIVSEERFKKSFAEYMKMAGNGRMFVIKRRGVPAVIVMSFSDKLVPKCISKKDEQK